jgi:hypothetical protein
MHAKFALILTSRFRQLPFTWIVPSLLSGSVFFSPSPCFRHNLQARASRCMYQRQSRPRHPHLHAPHCNTALSTSRFTRNSLLVSWSYSSSTLTSNNTAHLIEPVRSEWPYTNCSCRRYKSWQTRALYYPPRPPPPQQQQCSHTDSTFLAGLSRPRLTTTHLIPRPSKKNQNIESCPGTLETVVRTPLALAQR